MKPGSERVLITIYRSSRRPDMYLYVPKELALTDLPVALLEHFGKPQKVTDMMLTAQRKLARADAARVLQQLVDPGYYLQLPPSDQPNLLDEFKASIGNKAGS